MPLRLQRYNVVLEYKHEVPVQSLLILLRKEADSPSLTGEFRRHLPNGDCYDTFHYRTLRVWEIETDRLLQGDLATLPLAPLSAVSQRDVPSVIERTRAILKHEATDEARRNLTAATYLLMGLRFKPEFIDKLFSREEVMRESTTYQAVMAAERE